MIYRFLLFIAIAAASLGSLAFFGGDRSYNILYHSPDQFGGMWVYEKGGKRCLAFSPPPPAVDQNCILIDKPYKLISAYQGKILDLVIQSKKTPSRLLVIGMGGATLINALQSQLLQASIEVVEINDAIPALAENYFYFTPSAQTKIIIEDGAQFIKNLAHDIKYDLIIVDAFTPDYVPPSFLTKEFVTNLKTHLDRDGVVMVNSFTHHKAAKPEVQLYKEVFESVEIAPAHNNRILIAK